MLRRLAAAVLCVVILAGCGETSFVGRRFDNFTAYYNKFYNARKSFDNGVKGLQQADQPVNQDRFLAVYPVPERAGSRQDFEDAIKKSADVIRDHGGSKWVDDAVLLIGKSYFYQQNFVSAAQKFREAIALGSALEDEARFWLGRSLAANGSLLDARDELETSLRREDLDARWKSAMNLLLGDVLIRLREWDGAAEVLREGINHTRDGEAEARARFLLGQLEESRGAFQAAQESYATLRNLQPPYELAIAARLNELRLAARVGGIERALDDLRRLERDDKHRPKRADIAYVRALLLQEAGDARASREAYQALLYDSEFDISGVRGRAHYALGTLHRDAFEDFVLAAAHFDTAATVLQSGATSGPAAATEPLTAVAIPDSRQQADVFTTYAKVYGEVARMDSLLHLASLPEDEFNAFVRDLRLQLQEEMRARQRAEERQRGEAQFAEAFGQVQQGTTPQETAAAGEAGFLFHRDPMRVQEGKQSFIRRWGDRPLVPGWRRREAVDSYVREREQNAVADGSEPGPQLTADPDAALPLVDLSAVPRSQSAQQEMLERRALARYELGNVLFISMNQPDSAAAWYQVVIDEDAELPVAGRAFYALAELERSRGRTSDANNLYRVVLERYPGSEFEVRVREQLGMDTQVPTDSLALARARFDELMNVWKDGGGLEALSGMIELSGTAPNEELGAAALMAAARIGVDWIRRDSLQLTAPLPVALPDSTLEAMGFLHVEQPPSGLEGEPAVQGTAHVQEDLASSDSLMTAVSPAVTDTTVADTLEADLLDIPSPDAFASADSLEIRPRQLEAPPPRTVTVQQILTRLANTYATSPLAAQARSMLNELEERRAALEAVQMADASPAPGPSSDESEAATDDDFDEDPPVTAAADSVATAEADQATTTLSPPADDLAADAAVEPESTDGESQPPPPQREVYSLRGEGGLVLEAGGFTLHVGNVSTREAAEQLALELNAEGFRTEILLQHDDDGGFDVYVGQFQQRGLAEVALRTHQALLPEAATVVEVPTGDSP